MPVDKRHARQLLLVLLISFSKRDPTSIRGCPRIHKGHTMPRKSRATFPLIVFWLGVIARDALWDFPACIGAYLQPLTPSLILCFLNTIWRISPCF
jgi:hypothetical protein